MSNLTELREQQARLATNARAKLEEISEDTPAERAREIETEFDNMMAEYDSIDERLQREERLSSVEDRLAQPESRRPVPPDSRGSADVGEKAPDYREVFEKALRWGVGSLGEEERSVLAQNRSSELRAQSTTTDSEGGYTVPTEFSGEIDRVMAIWGPMWDANIVRELNTGTGRELEWPTVDDTANDGRIKDENSSVNDDGDDDVVFGEKKLGAYVYDTGMVRVPIELLQDSAFDMESLLNDLFGERLGRKANDILTTGNGTNKPEGIVEGSGAGKTAAAEASLDADEIIDLLHSVDPAYRASPSARWMFNDSTLATIRKLKDGQDNYLWQLGDIRVGEPATILGHPYSINQAMDDVDTSNKPILFGDFSRYIVRKVLGFQVMTLRERYAESFQVGVVGFKRFDGKLLTDKAVKHMVMDSGT